MKELWLIGKVLMVEDKEVGWMAEGAFLTEEVAIANIQTKDEFIVLVDIESRFPKYALDAKKCYFPKSETWEQSRLYQLKHYARESVKNDNPQSKGNPKTVRKCQE